MADATRLSVMSKQIEDNKQARDDIRAQMADLMKHQADLSKSQSHIEAMLSKLVSPSSGQTSRASGLNASPSGCLTNSRMTPPQPPDPPDFNQFGQRLSKFEFPVFDGTLPDCWSAKVDRFFELKQYGNEEKLDLISLSLEGAALKWFRKHRREFTDWTDIKRKLMARFRLTYKPDFPTVTNMEQSPRKFCCEEIQESGMTGLCMSYDGSYHLESKKSQIFVMECEYATMSGGETNVETKSLLEKETIPSSVLCDQIHATQSQDNNMIQQEELAHDTETIMEMGPIQEPEPLELADSIFEVDFVHSQEFPSQCQVPIPSLEPSRRCQKESLAVINDLSCDLGCVIGKTIGSICDSELGQDNYHDEEEFIGLNLGKLLKNERLFSIICLLDLNDMSCWTQLLRQQIFPKSWRFKFKTESSGEAKLLNTYRTVRLSVYNRNLETDLEIFLYEYKNQMLMLGYHGLEVQVLSYLQEFGERSKMGTRIVLCWKKLASSLWFLHGKKLLDACQKMQSMLVYDEEKNGLRNTGAVNKKEKYTFSGNIKLIKQSLSGDNELIWTQFSSLVKASEISVLGRGKWKWSEKHRKYIQRLMLSVLLQMEQYKLLQGRTIKCKMKKMEVLRRLKHFIFIEVQFHMERNSERMLLELVNFQANTRVLELIKDKASRKRKLCKNWWFKYKLNTWLSEALHFWRKRKYEKLQRASEHMMYEMIHKIRKACQCVVHETNETAPHVWYWWKTKAEIVQIVLKPIMHLKGKEETFSFKDAVTNCSSKTKISGHVLKQVFGRATHGLFLKQSLSQVLLHIQNRDCSFFGYMLMATSDCFGTLLEIPDKEIAKPHNIYVLKALNLWKWYPPEQATWIFSELIQNSLDMRRFIFGKSRAWLLCKMRIIHDLEDLRQFTRASIKFHLKHKWRSKFGSSKLTRTWTRQKAWLRILPKLHLGAFSFSFLRTRMFSPGEYCNRKLHR